MLDSKTCIGTHKACMMKVKERTSMQNYTEIVATYCMIGVLPAEVVQDVRNWLLDEISHMNFCTSSLMIQTPEILHIASVHICCKLSK
jgi:hypothetical protein